MFRKSYNIHLKLDMNEEVNLGDCKANIGCHDVSNLNHLDLISEGWCRAWCGEVSFHSRQSASRSVSPRCLRPGFIIVGIIFLPCLLPLLLSVVVHHLSYFHPPAAVVSQRHVQQAKSCCLLSLFLIIPTILSINVRGKCQAVLKITRR